MKQRMAHSRYSLASEYSRTSVYSLPLGETLWQLPLQYIHVLIRPSARTFSREMGKASWQMVLIQLLGLVVLTVMLGLLGHLLPFAALHAMTALSIGSVRPLAFLPSPLNGITFVFASFFIGLGTAYLFSKFYGGQGTLLAHCYCLLLCTIPLVTVSGILLLIPASGSFVILLASIVSVLFIYRMVLHTFTIMAVHRLSAGQATTIVLIFPMVIFAVAVLVMLLFATEGEALGEILAGSFDMFPWFRGKRRKSSMREHNRTKKEPEKNENRTAHGRVSTR